MKKFEIIQQETLFLGSAKLLILRILLPAKSSFLSDWNLNHIFRVCCKAAGNLHSCPYNEESSNTMGGKSLLIYCKEVRDFHVHADLNTSPELNDKCICWHSSGQSAKLSLSLFVLKCIFS